MSTRSLTEFVEPPSNIVADMRAAVVKRPVSTTLIVCALWLLFYASFTLVRPALLDDADSVHAEVAREMLLRHDYVTLYANGIRYLEKAPLLYWSMAASMRVAQLFGLTGPRALAAAARIPLALTVLALALSLEAFARRAFRSTRAGLYAALILLSSPGIFVFSRITLPDAMVCLWLTLAMLCFWIIEANAPLPPVRPAFADAAWDYQWDEEDPRLLCYGFAVCCALNVLTKGFIGLVFPVAIVVLYLLMARGVRGGLARINQLHPVSSALVFLAIVVPWHLLAAYDNPDRGNPAGIIFRLHPPPGAPHLFVPMPAQGSVHGWAWFYFINEQVLRYLNARVPRDYDTVPLWLFWGLCLVWLMPWSAFLFKALGPVAPFLHSAAKDVRARNTERLRQQIRYLRWHPVSRVFTLLTIWAALPLFFFSFSTRQEYYVLPALPAFGLLLAGWLAIDGRIEWEPVTAGARLIRRANLRCAAVLIACGAVFAVGAAYFIVRAHRPAANADLATLLQQNPGDYALSMGHFLDLNAQALGLFRVPLGIAALSLFAGPLASYLLRRRARPHQATLALAAGGFGFLLAVHLALETFAPVLSSARLAEAIRPQLKPDDLIVIHQEYEYGSTLGFYLQRPRYFHAGQVTIPINPIHILEGRSSNLWYGSFFPDAPEMFETADSLAAKWHGPQRIFLWQDLANQPSPLPAALMPAYVIVRSGGKEILSNQGTAQPQPAYPQPATAPEASHTPAPAPAADTRTPHRHRHARVHTRHSRRHTRGAHGR
jgi:4-amino-4-deoxy-L-arabinose transferase-like glycosyltransferase